MNKVTILAFILGAVAGSAATWFIVKTKYEQIANDEIESVKELYSEKHKKEYYSEEQIDETHNTVNVTTEKPSLAEYAKILKDEGYVDYATKKEKEEGGDEMSKPYVITPEEFGEAEGYDIVSLCYFADGTVTDDWNVPIEDVENTIGTDSLSHFGEYEDDSVFVRNDELKTDYEILRDARPFSEVRPYDSRMNDE